MKEFGKLLKYNLAYIIWFFIYWLIGVYVINGAVENVGLSCFYAALIYGVTIGVALSPIGETILRLLEGATPVLTQQDREYLIPIFMEVYEKARKNTPEMRRDIQLYISESMTVNAFAAGRKTIAVTRGAIETFDREQLKGILSHEFGHMAHNDTKALLINLVGNGFFSLILFALKFIMNIIQMILTVIQGKNIIFTAFWIMGWISKIFVEVMSFLFIFLGNILLSMNSVISEGLADAYAYKIGYGEELISSLYLLKKITLPAKMTIIEKMTATHPHIDERIQKLEQMRNVDVERLHV